MIRSDLAEHIWRFVGFVLFLTAVFAVMAHCTGCANPAEKALTAVEVAEWTLPYQFALDACRDEAKKKPRPQQWEAYQTCEDEETRKICERNPRMKAAWKRCLEVMP